MRIDIRDYRRYPCDDITPNLIQHKSEDHVETVADIIQPYLKNKGCKNISGPHYWCGRIVLPYAGNIRLSELKQRVDSTKQILLAC